MDIQVLYTKRNFSALSYNFNQKVDQYIYDENDEFVERKPLDAHISQYEVVGEHTVMSDRFDSDVAVRNSIVHSYNIGNKPSEITEKILSGESEASHSSFSVGDVIRIDDTYYISTGFKFEKLSESFVK